MEQNRAFGKTPIPGRIQQTEHPTPEVFSRESAVRRNPAVRSERDLHPRRVGAREGVEDLRADRGRLRADDLGEETVDLRLLADVLAGDDRGHVPGAVLLEQLDRLVVHEGPVLDGMDAGPDRPLHPLGPVGVRRHVEAVVAGGLETAEEPMLWPETSADLTQVIVTGVVPDDAFSSHSQEVIDWADMLGPPDLPVLRRIDGDIAAILYTSGSTGRPKGVVLSHRNMLAGAFSVAEYLENTADDRLLAVLPFSFDYGLSQLTTAFSVGASVVLMDYLLPRDVIRAVARYGITGLAAVPPLWNQLAALDWPEEARDSLPWNANANVARPALSEEFLGMVREH